MGFEPLLWDVSSAKRNARTYSKKYDDDNDNNNDKNSISYFQDYYAYSNYSNNDCNKYNNKYQQNKFGINKTRNTAHFNNPYNTNYACLRS